jgi:hypothetical protein
MAESLAINACNVTLSWNLINTTSFGANSTNNATFSFSNSYSNGTGAGKAQKLFVDQVTIAGASTQSYDLSGSLTDPLGATVTFSNVKGIYVQHTTSTATGLLQVYGNFTQASPGTTQPLVGSSAKINVKPMGCLLLTTGTTIAAGYTVTNSSADVITLDNQDAASVVVKVAVFGE